MGTITRNIAHNLTTGLGGAGGVNFRNLVINGDMSIAQRATSVSVSDGSNEGYQTCDRWSIYLQNAGSVYTWSQDTDVPTGQGFAKSMKFDVTTADTSLASNEEVNFRQKIEGQNLQYLKYGTSSAEQITLSFWVKTNKTGVYVVKLFNRDSTRDVSGSYTVADSNWNKHTITFPADTSGSFSNDNGSALEILWYLAAGSAVTGGTLNTSWRANSDTGAASGQVNFADSTSNNFYITGIQLEAGTTASEFEHLPVDVNLGRCQRYYHQIYSQSGTQAYASTLDVANCTDYDGGQLFCMKDLPTTMRAIPSIVQTTGTDYCLAIRNGGMDSYDGFNGVGQAGYNNIAIFTSGGEGYTGSSGVSVRVRFNAGYKLAANAEL